MRRQFGSMKLGMGMGGGLTGLDPDTQSFIDRVLADGGTVEDVGFLNSFILDAKANNYFTDIVAAYSPSWGVKGTTTASDLYSITGVGSDLIQVTAASQPLINTSDLNGKARLLFDGADDFLVNTGFLWGSTVRTAAMGGFEQESWSFGGSPMADSVGATKMKQDEFTPDLLIFDGVRDTGISNAAAVIGVPSHFNGLFDQASSEILINNANSTTGSIGNTHGNGVHLGSGFNGTNTCHMSVGMFVLLTAANDIDYAAKMTALYNFSKSAYGTP